MTLTARDLAAQRMSRIPPYLFAEIDKKVAAKRSSGVDVIALDIGDPDTPTPAAIVEAAIEAVRRGENHRYASYFGMPALREAIAGWYKRRFNVDLDPSTEVLPTLGSKDGISHLPFALVNPGDIVLVPSPGYPVYITGTVMADGEPYILPLTKEHDWLPDLDTIPEAVAFRARILWLNYPNNPTAAVAPRDFFEKALDFCRRHGIVLCHDFPYSEVSFRGYRAASVLEFPGAKEVAVEFHSLSKTFNMTGWRVGMAVGNPEVLRLLGQVKTNIDSGIFPVVQHAAIAALNGPELGEMNQVYERRQARTLEVLREIGWPDATAPEATFYLWLPVPEGYSSVSFASHVLDEAGVNVTPGNGFGEPGEGYFRLSLTVPDHRLDEALERLRKLRF
ncbi:MAG TPA: LL-diaminopimelate aminotransferase [Candidatus Dormibacteraeota bacterium]|nr:LL-diaminopimelate aminotransferase [Candidatus Dormibacteraeota bacterium]